MLGFIWQSCLLLIMLLKCSSQWQCMKLKFISNMLEKRCLFQKVSFIESLSLIKVFESPLRSSPLFSLSYHVWKNRFGSLKFLLSPWFFRLIFLDHYKLSWACVSSENDCSFSNLVWLLDFIQFLSLDVERENFLETVFFNESDSRTMPLLRSTN